MVRSETDPTGRSSHEPGAKLDAGKSPILRGVIQYFPRALEAVANVSLTGSKKYAWKSWESVPDGINRYGDALGRHLIAEETEGPIDQQTGMLHAAQEAWNALARLELMLREIAQANKKAQSNDWAQAAKPIDVRQLRGSVDVDRRGWIPGSIPDSTGDSR